MGNKEHSAEWSARRRLTVLYTLTTGTILTLVVFGILLYNLKEAGQAQLRNFNEQWITISSKLQFDSEFSYSWLSRMEAEHGLIIHIEENGIPLRYPGASSTSAEREQLIEKVKTMAREENVDIAKPPVSSAVNQSSLFQLKGEAKQNLASSSLRQNSYYSMAMAISTQGRESPSFQERGKSVSSSLSGTDQKAGVKGLVVISLIVPGLQLLKHQIIFLTLLDLLGIAGLFGVSRQFAGWSLKPIEESRKKQSEFIASASHELRSPLAVIRSSVSAIKAAPDQEERLLSNIDRECQRMSLLVGDMLLLASTDAQTWSLRMEKLDVDTFLIEEYELFLPLCREKGLCLRLQLPEEESFPMNSAKTEESLFQIYGDGERLRQVMAVLLDNAIDHTPSGKSIAIEAHYIPEKSFLSIDIIDQGCGIPDERKQQIFDRFYRGDVSRNDKQHFGLGLSIAKELVRMHEGKISVSDSVGGGCCFTVLLSMNRPHQQ